MTMSDSDHPNPNPPSSPVAAEEPDLQDQVDGLLDDVEALTKETLGESESDKARAPADVPTTDPAKEVVADDVGLSSESPLVQDGERTPVEEVAAGVDQELDQMEKLIGGLDDSASPTDSNTSGHADVPAEPPVEAPDSEPATGIENATASDDDLIGSIEEQPAAAEPVVDAESDSTPSVAEPAVDAESESAPPAEFEDASLDADIAELVASTLEPEPPDEPDALIADQIPAEPVDLQPGESAKETSLDEDLDALLASSEVAALEDPIGDVSPPADPADPIDSVAPPATTDTRAPKPKAATHSDIDLASIPIRRVVKLKLKARSRHVGLFIGRRGTNALVWLLDRIDAKIGKKLPPMARELAGYCALATLAMSIIAIIIFLI